MKNTNVKIKLIIVPVLLFFLSFCTYYNEEDLYPDELCDTFNVSYSNDVKPIFEQNCYSCHSSSVEYYGNLNLENFEHILRVVNDGKLLKNIKHEPGGIPMPEGAGKLADCKINTIEAWIKRGTPNN